MRVSNLLVLSVLSLIATIGFMSIPEVTTGARAAGPVRSVNHEMLVTDVPELATNHMRQG